MMFTYWAVAEDGEWKWVTTFAQVDHLTCSLPSGFEGALDVVHYQFKSLTLSEYETYIATGSLMERDSDDFVILRDPPRWKTITKR